MSKIKYLTLLIVPIFILCWGFFNIYFFDTFYSRAVDPEYPYLFNGLNVALLEFNRIGHFDHPGTPFQLFCGLVIRITHLFSGNGSITQDVFNRPDYYLNAINVALVFLQSAITFFIAWLGNKRGIKIFPLLLLQSGMLLTVLTLILFSRVIPERWLLITFAFYILVYLQYGYKNRNSLKFAIWSGIVMGMGFATKFNFLPLSFLPLLLISNNKHRLIYIITGIASFFIFVLPIINKLKEFRLFITSIATHDGIYGQGKEQMFNLEKMKAGVYQVFEMAPELAILISTVIVALLISIFYKNEKNRSRNILFFVGTVFVCTIQILMVSKHFKDTYLVPVFSIYGFILFMLSEFCDSIFKAKSWRYVPILLLFGLFIGLSSKGIYNRMNFEKQRMDQREEMRQYVTNKLPRKTLWFVEPTWESAPYVENGIIYGTCYCHHYAKYISELTTLNPNIITYQGIDNPVTVWRHIITSLDSVVVTRTPLYIFSSPVRNAHILMQMVVNAAENAGVFMNIDTVFTQSDLNSHIIRMRNNNSDKDLQRLDIFSRELQIQANIKAIYDSPEWLQSVKQKAIERNISLDSMVLVDAVWMIDNP